MLWLHYLILTNHTVDDSDPSVLYTGAPASEQCNTACPGLFNGTGTFTASPIIVSFTGSALYIYLAAAGVCTFIIDGDDVGNFNFNNSLPNYKNSIQPAYHNNTIPDGHHVLTISPAATTLIEFDYLIYTESHVRSGQTSAPRGIRVGAIVGGVLGRVALILALLIAAFFLRRRERQRKFFNRGVPLSEDDKTSIRMNQMAGKS
ncbi:hypothetical protein B0H11DRAFT_1913417 [Mycena galericulata]|nr:hypothetical protein B0H11DRAFT_1913417 [Mycena galericulata]